MKAESITVTGALEALHGSGLVLGWAYAPDHPRAAAKVYVFLDGRPLGVAEATHSREDHLDLGIGHGNVGFAFKLPPVALKHLRIGGVLKLCLDAEGHYDLKNSPVSIDEQIFEILQRGMQQARLVRLTGSLDGFIPTQGVYGWAWDPEYPDDVVHVYLFDEQGWLGEVRADQFRQDVMDAGFGNGQYGFSATLENTPSLSRIHNGSSIRACFDREGRAELGNSPLTLTPASAEPWEWKVLTRNLPIAPESFTLDHAIVTPARAASESHRERFGPVALLGGVYSSEGRLDIRASLNRTYGVCQYAPTTITENPTDRIDEACIYGGVLNPHFGHFVTESLARARHFMEHPQAPIIYTCMYPNLRLEGASRAYLKDIFKLLGIPLERLRIIQSVTEIRELLIPQVGLRHWDHVDVHHVRFLEDRIASHPGICLSSESNKKVYLSRSRLTPPTVGPAILGEELFQRYLAMEGFTVIHPQELNIVRQIEAIASAEFLVGFIGSAFHTLLLSHQKPGHVIYLERQKHSNFDHFSPMDQAKGLKATYLDQVIETASSVALIDFQGISESLQNLGVVKNTFRQKPKLYNSQMAYQKIFDIMKMSLFELTRKEINALNSLCARLPDWANLPRTNTLLRMLRSRLGN